MLLMDAVLMWCLDEFETRSVIFICGWVSSPLSLFSLEKILTP